MKTALLAFLMLASVSASAQFGAAPEYERWGRRKRPAHGELPVAQALALALGATVWADVQISSAGPAADLTSLVRQGYYKLELIELVLICSEAKKPLMEAVGKRKKGAKLSEIARDYKVDYDKIYENALAVQELIDKEYLPRLYKRRRAGKSYD